MQPYHLPVVAKDAEINPMILRVAVYRGHPGNVESNNLRAVENHVAVGVIAKISEPIEDFSIRQVLVRTITRLTTPLFQESVGSAMPKLHTPKGCCAGNVILRPTGVSGMRILLSRPRHGSNNRSRRSKRCSAM